VKIAEFLHADAVVASLSSSDKAGVLGELCAPLSGKISVGPDRVVQVLLERERLSSTAVGDGVAIPHGKIDGLPGLVATFGVSRQGVDFDAVDGKKTHLFFVLLAPENSPGVHLKALARVSRLFKSPALRKAILDAADAQAVYELIAREDEKA
jgi:PTS system nitrogen regulatory IIA component